MDHTDLMALQARLEQAVRAGWSLQDPNACVSSTVTPDGKIDMTVISHRFEGLDAREREAMCWQVFGSVPRSDRLYMTCCLLLTPEEAHRLGFSSGGAPG